MCVFLRVFVYFLVCYVYFLRKCVCRWEILSPILYRCRLVDAPTCVLSGFCFYFQPSLWRLMYSSNVILRGRGRSYIAFVYYFFDTDFSVTATRRDRCQSCTHFPFQYDPPPAAAPLFLDKSAKTCVYKN